MSPGSKRTRSLEGAAWAMALAVGLFASSVLALWALGVITLEDALRQPRGLAPLRPMSAVAAAFAALSLGLAGTQASTARRSLGALTGALVAVIGVLTLLEVVQLIDVGFGRWLSPAGDALALRMAPLTALSFFLVGMALTACHVGASPRRAARAAEWFVLAALLVPFFTLVGALYGLGAPPGLEGYPEVPVQTAVTLLLLEVGVLLANPQGRILERFVSSGAGGAMARMLLPSVILVPLAIGGLVVLARSSGLFDENVGAALHTLATVLALASIAWMASGRLQRLDVDRERVLDELRTSEARFRALATASTNILWLTDQQGRPKADSPSWRAFTGQTIDEWMSERWALAIHPDDRERVAGEWREAVERKVPAEMEYRLCRPDGSWTWTAARTAPVTDVDGTVVEWIGTNTDIARKKLNEDALHASTKRLRLLAEISQELAAAGLDQELVAASVVGSVCDVVGDAAALSIVEPDKSLRHLAASHRDPRLHKLGRDVLMSTRMHVGEGFGGLAIAEKRTFLVPHLTVETLEDVQDPLASLLLQADIRSLLSVPILLDGEAIGVLTLTRGGDSPIFDDNDRMLVEELARRTALALQNVWLYERAQAAIRLRDEFLSVASHELRTPLTTLKLQVSAALMDLMRAGTDPTRMERLRRLDAQVERMTRLVNQLLDVAQLASGRLALELQRVDLLDVTQEVVGWFRDQAERAHCRLEVKKGQHVEASVDANRIGQVITNLLSNALKYGAGKPIEVSVERTDGHARILVEDHGIGVAPEDQRRIFERFERAASVRNYGGLGLGLWISKQIVEKHGGHIEVTSSPNQGATFIVELPLVMTSAESAEGANAHGGPA